MSFNFYICSGIFLLIKPYLYFFCFAYSSIFAQASIFGDIVLHKDVQLTFFNTPVYFIDGNISGRENQNAFVVFSGAQATSASADSHVETPILSINHSDFTFPTGDQGVYQPFSIKNGDENDLKVKFQRVPYEDLSLPAEIDLISSQFHWLVSGEKTAQLGLSWNSSSLLNQMTNDLQELVILGYSEAGWEVIPSKLAPFAIDGITPVSIEEGMIISEDNIALNSYVALTLGGVKSISNIMISEALTPNGDNINDTWYIENIESYTDVIIRVYNRWGGEVFFHQGTYRNDWNGSSKNNLKILPAAPYYYRIDLDNDGFIEHQGWIYINY